MSEKKIRELIEKLDQIEADMRGCEMRVKAVRLELVRLNGGAPR